MPEEHDAPKPRPGDMVFIADLLTKQLKLCSDNNTDLSLPVHNSIDTQEAIDNIATALPLSSKKRVKWQWIVSDFCCSKLQP